MTYTFQKKDIIYGSIIVFLVFTLVASLIAYNFRTATNLQSVKSYQADIGAADPNSQKTEDVSGIAEGVSIPGSNLQHLTCDGQIEFTTLPSSTTYNPNGLYRPDFMSPGANFQDINGDGLVDYTFNYQNLYGSNPELTSLTKSCVFLNNGQGWDRSYICYARTVINTNTGNVVEGEYRGDCADTSIVAGDGNE